MHTTHPIEIKPISIPGFVWHGTVKGFQELEDPEKIGSTEFLAGKVKDEIRQGLWDVADNDLVSQSRVGEYIVILGSLTYLFNNNPSMVYGFLLTTVRQ